MSNQQAKKRQALSAKPFVENRPVAGRGIGAVQLPDGVKFFKFQKAGAVKIDIVPYRTSKPHLHPYAVDGIWYERTYHVHRNVGDGNASVICPKQTFGKPCPICEYRATLDWSDEEDKKRIMALRPQERQLYNVIVHEDGGKISDVMVLDQSRFGFGKMLDELVKNADEEDDHYQYFSDLEQGSTLKVILAEISGGAFKFFGASSIEFKPRKAPYDESILDKTVDLDTVLMATSYEEIRSLFYGTGSDETSSQQDAGKGKSKPAKHDEDEDDDSNWSRTQKALAESNKEAKAEKPKAKPSVDEDEDDEPAAKPKAKAKPPVDDDDDDDPPVKPQQKAKAKPPVDADDDDDEPVSKPKPKAKAEATETALKPKKKVNIEDWDDDDD